jgi:hypothetical protein
MVVLHPMPVYMGEGRVEGVYVGGRYLICLCFFEFCFFEEQLPSVES